MFEYHDNGYAAATYTIFSDVFMLLFMLALIMMGESKLPSERMMDITTNAPQAVVAVYLDDNGMMYAHTDRTPDDLLDAATLTKKADQYPDRSIHLYLPAQIPAAVWDTVIGHLKAMHRTIVYSVERG